MGEHLRTTEAVNFRSNPPRHLARWLSPLSEISKAANGLPISDGRLFQEWKLSWEHRPTHAIRKEEIDLAIVCVKQLWIPLTRIGQFREGLALRNVEEGKVKMGWFSFGKWIVANRGVEFLAGPNEHLNIKAGMFSDDGGDRLSRRRQALVGKEHVAALQIGFDI